jgi:glycosyltransferase involved in cell wall biosynthesis
MAADVITKTTNRGVVEDSPASPRVAVVIPCYRVRQQILSLLARIGPEVSLIYCIDDACPDGSGSIVEQQYEDDPRVHVIRHDVNGGVGAAVVTGYEHALRDQADIIVKLDGDGQMDPSEIAALVAPIAEGSADYAKGNRFWKLEGLRSMPWIRLAGNAGMSFFSKLSSGYWNLFDPANGFTAIHANVARELPLKKLSRRYFFESDILFRLNTLQAVVVDVSTRARYADEQSSLSVWNSLVAFPVYHARNFAKRLFYNYFLRDFTFASVNLLLGVSLALFGFAFGVIQWTSGSRSHELASSGTVMLAALPLILGVQMLLSFINADMANIPRDPIHDKLRSHP